MGRFMTFVTLAVVIGLVTDLVLHRVVVGMLVTGGILLVGLLVLISRAEPEV